MRDLTDTLTRGPFCDDTHRAAVEATAMDLFQKPLAKLRTAIRDAKQCRTYELHETPPWASQGDQRATKVEAEDGRVRAVQADIGSGNVFADPAVEKAERDWHASDDAAWNRLALSISQTYDAATRVLASAGPLPLASTEPWVESDEAYAKRIGNTGKATGHELDDLADWRRPKVVRARLVPATTMQQGEP